MEDKNLNPPIITNAIPATIARSKNFFFLIIITKSRFDLKNVVSYNVFRIERTPNRDSSNLTVSVP